MTLEQISFRDFIRGYIPADVLMLFDKKTKANKGLFVKAEYADIVLDFLKQQEQKKVEAKRKALFDFVGKFGDDNNAVTEKHQAIKAKKYE